jgi:hypothetical protein
MLILIWVLILTLMWQLQLMSEQQTNHPAMADQDPPSNSKNKSNNQHLEMAVHDPPSMTVRYPHSIQRSSDKSQAAKVQACTNPQSPHNPG